MSKVHLALGFDPKRSSTGAWGVDQPRQDLNISITKFYQGQGRSISDNPTVIINSNVGYCYRLLRVLEISPTTRILVPRI